MTFFRLTAAAALTLAAACTASAQAPAPAAAPKAPRILIDLPERQVEYQLGRLTSEQLVEVERKDDDPKYRPVYRAILARRGVPASFRDEAVAALVKLDKSTPARVLLTGLAKIPGDDEITAERVLGMLFALPAASLKQDQAAFSQAASAAEPWVRTGAYGAAMIADGSAAAAWKTASSNGHLADLMRGVRYLGKHPALQQELAAPILAVSNDASAGDARVQALGTLGWTRRDTATFDRLAREVSSGAGGAPLAPGVSGRGMAGRSDRTAGQDHRQACRGGAAGGADEPGDP